MQGLGMFNDAVLRQSRQAGASPQVVSAVRQASASTGVDFSYLMEKASLESGYNPDAKAASSSATGLYQFTDSTWLDMMAQHGAQHSLGALASEISYRADGQPTVADAGERKKILDLRKDPEVAAAMAAELARSNKAQLQSAVGGQIGGTELYLAHFLGAGGAAKFIDAYRQNPNQPAATILPDAAASNPGVFNDSTSGKPATLAQIYDRFAAHFSGSTFLNGSNVAAATIPTNAMTAAAISKIPVSPQSLSDRAIPGIGGPTLSLYAILALASLDVPTRPGDNAVRDKNDPYQAGRVLLGL